MTGVQTCALPISARCSPLYSPSFRSVMSTVGEASRYCFAAGNELASVTQYPAALSHVRMSRPRVEIGVTTRIWCWLSNGRGSSVRLQ